jgi:hypothetical protein
MPISAEDRKRCALADCLAALYCDVCCALASPKGAQRAKIQILEERWRALLAPAERLPPAAEQLALALARRFADHYTGFYIARIATEGRGGEVRLSHYDAALPSRLVSSFGARLSRALPRFAKKYRLEEHRTAVIAEVLHEQPQIDCLRLRGAIATLLERLESAARRGRPDRLQLWVPPGSTPRSQHPPPFCDPELRPGYTGQREVDLIGEVCRGCYAMTERECKLDLTRPPRLRYRQKGALVKFTSHQGQRKLFLSELEFLARHARPADAGQVAVVYAGAATGEHIPELARWFPELEFHLYDPAEFHILSEERLHIYNEPFTDATARGWAAAGRPVLFISDVRVVTPGNSPRDEQVMQDMTDQLRWALLMENVTRQCLFKFLLPYSYGERAPPSNPFAAGYPLGESAPPSLLQGRCLYYPPGQLFKQAYHTLSGSETRWEGRPRQGEALVPYDARAYEDLMYEHNVVTREWKSYAQPVRGVPGLGIDYDSTRLARGVRDYLAARGRPASPLDVCRELLRLLRRLPGPSTLVDPPYGIEPRVPMWQKRERLYHTWRDFFHEKRQHRRAKKGRRATGNEPRGSPGAKPLESA